MTIILATKVPQKDVLERTTISRFTGEQVTYIRKTPHVTQDDDTCAYLKYWLYAKVKRMCLNEVRYDTMADFATV